MVPWTAVCVRLMTLADVCRGRAGVHMSEWCVPEVREVQAACVVTSQGRRRRRREQAWSVVWVCIGEPIACSATSDIYIYSDELA